MNTSATGVSIIAEKIDYCLVLGRRDRLHPAGSIHPVVLRRKHKKGAAMKKAAICAGLFAILAIPMAVPTTTSAQTAERAEANAVNVTGKVSCSKFGTGSITARKGMSIAQTIWYCATFQGGQYTLVSGKQIFLLTGDRNQLAKVAGQSVVVAGHVAPEEPVTSYALMGNLQATSIAPAKN
jgi:hypothetical protein